jgi:hypothetical protein
MKRIPIILLVILTQINNFSWANGHEKKITQYDLLCFLEKIGQENEFFFTLEQGEENYYQVVDDVNVVIKNIDDISKLFPNFTVIKSSVNRRVYHIIEKKC